MKKKLISFTIALFCVLFCAALSVPAAAEGEAEEISASAELYSWDTDETASMTDKNESHLRDDRIQRLADRQYGEADRLAVCEILY